MAGRNLEAITVDTWLKDLRMECYKRNLEEYPNVQSLVVIKDFDLKRLGIANARDRATMMRSLASLQSNKIQGFGSNTNISGQNSDNHFGSLLKKGRKLKGLLGGSSGLQKKNKKTHEVLISGPQPHVAPIENEGNGRDNVSNLTPIPETKSRIEQFARSLPSPGISSSLEDLFRAAEHQRYAVENDYVPDPQGSPQFIHNPIQRSYTVSETRPSYREQFVDTQKRRSTVDFNGCLLSISRPSVDISSKSNDDFDHLSPIEDRQDAFEWKSEEDTDGSPTTKHLSVVSMESGLGLTCDSDDKGDFNRSINLEEQPWFHGPIGCGVAETLLDEDGDFLVHENVDGSYTLSLIWEGRCYHMLINCNEIVMKGLGGAVTIGYKYQFDNGAFDSVPELIFNHLRYQIPISKEFDAIITHPICKTGARSLNHSSYAPEVSNKGSYSNRTLPKDFGRTVSNLRPQRNVISPEPHRTVSNNRSSIRGTRSASISPCTSPRTSPSRDFGTYSTLRTSSSSNLILVREDDDEDEASNMAMASVYKDVPTSPIKNQRHSNPTLFDETTRPRTIDPYSTYDVPIPSTNAHHDMRLRAKTYSSARNSSHSCSSLSTCTMSDSSDYQHPRPTDPDDYEVMESVSVRKTLPSPNSSPRPSPQPSPRLSPKFSHKPPTHTVIDSHYAMVTPKALRQQFSTPTSGQPGVKYAEITFNRSQSTSSHGSRSDLLARSQKLSVTYVTPRMVREQMAISNGNSPHPFSSIPSNDVRTSSSSSLIKSKQDSRMSKHSSTQSFFSSQPGSRNLKLPQTIQEVPAFLKEFTNDEIAIHLTKADAVCFLLAPRPGENADLWQNRVQEVTADGVFVGLQILASSVGIKLWKKLFHRHLSLSQLVILSMVQCPESVDRAKTLKRWIELASLLQSGTYGNLFAFMAVMKGLESPQIGDLTKTWDILRNHCNETFNIYKNQLKGMISALSEGASVYAIEELTVPAVQHLRKLYNVEGQLTSVAGNQDIRAILEDFTTRVIGLDGLHAIIKHTSDFCCNANKRLNSYSYDSVLFDFFMQDIVRTHLQNIGTSAEDPLERYRRFNIVLDALVSKLDDP